MKYKNWLNEWYENYVEPSAKPKTKKQYSEIIQRRLTKVLGEYELEALTPIVLQGYIAKLLKSGNLKTGKGLSVNSVLSIISVIKISLKNAYLSGRLKKYTGDKIILPRVTEKEITCFTLEEQKKMEKAILVDNKGRMVGVLICLYTGLRIGELLALKWESIDLKRGIISVNATCHDGTDENGKFCRITNSPKTASSKRLVPIPNRLLAILRENKKKRKTDYVVETTSGSLPCVRYYQRAFEVFQARLNIQRKGFHALRHTFATRALECGMDVKSLSEILGHKNAVITLNRYVHSLMNHKRELMNKLGRNMLG